MRRFIWLVGLILLGGIVMGVGGSALQAAQAKAAQTAAGPAFRQPGGLLTNTPTATGTPNPCGLAWRIVPSANSGASTNALAAVAVAGPDDVWAAGYYNDTQAQADKTLIEHWTGTSWSIVPSANVGSNSNTLAGLAVVNPSDIWSVGSYFNTTNGHLQTLTEHWNGSSWTVIPSPNVANTDTLLNSVTAISSTDVWAVGG